MAAFTTILANAARRKEGRLSRYAMSRGTATPCLQEECCSAPYPATAERSPVFYPRDHRGVSFGAGPEDGDS